MDFIKKIEQNEHVFVCDSEHSLGMLVQFAKQIVKWGTAMATCSESY